MSKIHTMFVECVNGLASRLAKGDDNGRVRAMRAQTAPKTGLVRHPYALDAVTCSALETLYAVKPEDMGPVLRGDVNPTIPYRFAQYVNGLVVGSYPHIDRATARGMVAMRDAGGTLNRDALIYVLTGKVSEDKGESINTKGVTLRKLDRFVGRVGTIKTAQSQVSRTFGATGFGRALGMVSVDAARTNYGVTLNMGHPMVARFFALIDGATDNQLASIGQASGTEE